MALPINVIFTNEVTVISQPWGQGANDWIWGAYGVLGATYTATAFRSALGAVASGSSISIGGAVQNGALGTTNYRAIFGSGNPTTASYNYAAQIAPISCVIDQLRVKDLSTLTGGGCTVTLMVDGADTALTATYTFPATAANNLVNAISVTAGQTVSLKYVFSGTYANSVAGGTSGSVRIAA